MTLFKQYILWKLAHCNTKKPEAASLNLFDKGNLITHRTYHTTNVQSTETGVSFQTSESCATTTYAQCVLTIGNAADFKGKTLVFSSPSYGGTSATKISVMKSLTAVQNGSNWSKVGDVYYSQITVEDKEYTDEKICIMLYAYGKGANELILYDEIMVNEGGEVLPYEPYKK